MATFRFHLASIPLCFAVVVAALSGQDGHRIPERGAALYDRVIKRETKILQPDPASVKHKYVHDVPGNGGPAVILHSDLDRKGLALRHAPTTLFELGSHLALDLTTWGKKKRSIVAAADFQPFGSLRMTGRSEPVTAGNKQSLSFRVGADPASKRGRRQAALVGEMKIVRQFDPERGLVVAFTIVFTGELHYSGRPADQIQSASFRLDDSWTLRELVANRGPKFDAAVGAAIRKGAEYLKKQVTGDLGNKFSPKPDQSGQTKKTGELALVLLTLLKAGESPRDPVVSKALDDLRSRKIYDTYSLGVAMLALEACYTPARERDDLLSGRIAAPQPRPLSDDDRQRMREWVAQLLANRTEGSRDTATRWHYLAGPGFDNSNTQYALLGLYAAHLCGVEVDREVWVGAARHFLRVQAKPEDRIRLSLLHHRELEKKTAGSRTVGSIEPAGWTYVGKYALPTGSMTTAGIASLTICDAALGRARRPREVSGTVLRGAIRSGFAWMAKHYSVRHNPGAANSWRLYYLYGLERACELGQVAHLQGYDWYFDGATLLLEEQAKDGQWGGDIDTCFAILFLKKAALPVFTGKR